MGLFPRTTHRHLTGHNHQVNAKATADTVKWFNAICDAQRWVAGLALEHLVALGEAALRLGTIPEAIGALERELARDSLAFTVVVALAALGLAVTWALRTQAPRWAANVAGLRATAHDKRLSSP